MKKYISILTVILMVCFMSSCDKNRSARKDRSVGGTAEILVVTQNDEIWNGRIGDSFHRFE